MLTGAQILFKVLEQENGTLSLSALLVLLQKKNTNHARNVTINS